MYAAAVNRISYQQVINIPIYSSPLGMRVSWERESVPIAGTRTNQEEVSGGWLRRGFRGIRREGVVRRREKDLEKGMKREMSGRGRRTG